MASQHDPLTTEQSGSWSPPGLLQILWTRKALIILGAVIGLMLGGIYFAQRKPVFESSAQVYVIKKTPDMPMPGWETYGLVEDYLNTHLLLISSPIILDKAVKSGELDRLKTFEGCPNPTAIMATIHGSLRVSREAQQAGSFTGPSILNLSYHGSDPDDCPIILTAVIKSYESFLFEQFRSKNADTGERLEAARDELKVNKLKAEKEYETLRKDGPAMVGKDGVTVQEEKLMAVQTRVSSLAIRRAELQAKLAIVETALAQGLDPALLLDLSEASKGSNGSLPPANGAATASEASLDIQLMPQLIELQSLENRFGPNHPDVRALRGNIDTAREILKRTLTPKKSTPAASAQQPPEAAPFDAGVGSVGLLATPFNQAPLVASIMLVGNRSATREVTVYLQALRRELNEVRVTEKALLDMADQDAKSVHGLAEHRNKEASLRKEIANMERDLEVIMSRLKDLGTLRNAGGFQATVIAPPGQGAQIEPRLLPIMMEALLFGLLAGVALAWIAEISDKSFRTPEEVRRRLGLAVVGHVPPIVPEREAVLQHETGQLALDPSICAFYRSKSIEAESFRGIRTTLYFSSQNEDCKIIQVTSPNMGDGKTTLATNLAVSIAQSGKKILLVDADFRRPRLHRMFGLKARTGLASVIQDEAELTDAIQATVVPNLFVLPCGPRPSNPAELLTSPRFKQVLETLRDKFDLILIDTPPLLAVSDPSVVASQVDGVLMTIRVSKNGRPAAERARDLLANLQVKVLGVIVNGIGTRGQEGYGTAHYGYQYQYHYTYEPTDNRSYYHDHDTEQAHKNGEADHEGLNGVLPPHDEFDPDQVGASAEPERSRERVPGSRRKLSGKPGVVSGLTKWLRTTLWH